MNAIVPFIFDDQAVRVTDRDGQPWFVLADVCLMLGLKNPTMAARPLDETEKAQLNLGRGGDATIVSLSGLLTLMLRCRGAMKPGTVPYRARKWITAEVVPTIMRTGSYNSPAIATDVDDNATLRRLLLGRLDAIEEMQPKVAAFERIAQAGGSLILTEAAKVLKVERVKLIADLERMEWIYRKAGTDRWTGYRAKEAAGLVTHHASRLRHGPKAGDVVHTVAITTKGLTKLSEIFEMRSASTA